MLRDVVGSFTLVLKEGRPLIVIAILALGIVALLSLHVKTV